MDSVIVSMIHLGERKVLSLWLLSDRTDTSTRILGAIYTVPKPIRHNHGVSQSHYFRSWILWLSMALKFRGRSFLFG